MTCHATTSKPKCGPLTRGPCRSRRLLDPAAPPVKTTRDCHAPILPPPSAKSHRSCPEWKTFCVRSEAALAIYICRQHNMPHYRFWDLGLKGQALRQIRAPSELAPWVQARGWREIAFFRFFSLPAPAATDPPANFIHTLTNHSQGPGSNAWHSMSQH